MISPATVDRLRGVVVGLGVMGSHHCRVLASLAEAQLVAVVDPDTAARERALRSRPSVAAYATLEQALAAHALDFACIATPVVVLAEAAVACLHAGLHVLVEKPTAPSEAAALELAREVERTGLVLSVGHVERFNPAVVALKPKLDEQAIGRVLQLQARRLSPYPLRQPTTSVALDLATHDIDVMRYLSGSEVARVYAETAHQVHEGSVDMVGATLRFDDDSIGLLEINWLTPTKVRELTVTGERGMFAVNYVTQDLVFFEHPTQATEWDALAGIRGGGEGDMIRFALDRREPLLVEWEAFLGAVRAGGPPPVGVHEGIAALSTAEAIRQAGAEHGVVVPGYRRAGVV
jgi:UDP-N-acetylglucosamine 3-dehydrogenase